MVFKGGNLAFRELSSQRYKDRDETDMVRVGKKQRFEVSCSRHICTRWKLISAAKFQLPVHVGFYHNNDVYLGGGTLVSSIEYDLRSLL